VAPTGRLCPRGPTGRYRFLKNTRSFPGSPDPKRLLIFGMEGPPRMSSSDRSTVLLLMSQADVAMIDAALRPLNVDVLCAHDLREARKRVSTAQPIDVVVTDVTLPDGNWSDVIRWVVDGGGEASVVVCAPRADEFLWSEVLWRGGYDILVPPYRPQDVRRVIEGAQRASFPVTWRSPRPKPPRAESRVAAASVH